MALNTRLTRQGYSTKALAESISVQPKVIRAFLQGKLSSGQAKEILITIELQPVSKDAVEQAEFEVQYR